MKPSTASAVSPSPTPMVMPTASAIFFFVLLPTTPVCEGTEDDDEEEGDVDWGVGEGNIGRDAEGGRVAEGKRDEREL